MPRGAQIVRVAEQILEGAIWAIVDPGAERELRTFEIRGTGHEIEDGAVYVGTFEQRRYGTTTFVWHVFETTARGGVA